MWAFSHLKDLNQRKIWTWVSDHHVVIKILTLIVCTTDSSCHPHHESLHLVFASCQLYQWSESLNCPKASNSSSVCSRKRPALQPGPKIVGLWNLSRGGQSPFNLVTTIMLVVWTAILDFELRVTFEVKWKLYTPDLFPWQPQSPEWFYCYFDTLTWFMSIYIKWLNVNRLSEFWILFDDVNWFGLNWNVSL